MKNLVIKTLLLIGICAFTVSCTTLSTDEEEASIVTEVEIQSPDKSKIKAPGTNN